jgi:formylglycine-generating enzyme required for sulfatase activity
MPGHGTVFRSMGSGLDMTEVTNLRRFLVSRPLDNHCRWWSYVPWASWRHPEDRGFDIKDRTNHRWGTSHMKTQLRTAGGPATGSPTEAEFEFASRGGLDRKRYTCGGEFMPGGKDKANTFQGHFPDANTGEDGYLATAPGGSFPANGYGRQRVGMDLRLVSRGLLRHSCSQRPDGGKSQRTCA